MTVQKITPEILEISTQEVIALEESAEWHAVPFGQMRVDAYKGDALIREAAALYWQPGYNDLRADNRNFQGSRGGALYDMMYNCQPAGLDGNDEYDFSITAKLILTYPLQETWHTTIQVPANRLGEIFAYAHDMYEHVYELDAAAWQSEGHQDKAPRAGAILLNRASGEHVWGHDMSDLVFEAVQFIPDSSWPKEERNLRLKIVNIENLEQLFKPPPPEEQPVEYAMAALDKEKHGGKAPLIGTFMFMIGS